MKQKIKLIAVLLVLMLFANFYLAIGQNMDRYITLTVKQGEMIMLAFTADSDNTPVKVVSGTKDTTVMVSATIFNRREYYAQTTTMTVYGNVACFDCGKNKTKVTGVDFSHNTALTYLDCPDNSLTTLDVSKNTALTSLDCSDNSLTTLDVSKNTTLKSLYCSDNSLTTLDVSKNTTLKSLYCSDNSLSSLDISKNTKLVRLECNNTLLTTLDVSKHPDLKYLYCSQNSLTTLNISNNKELTELGGNSNLLTVLDVSNNTKLYKLNCSQNSLTELNISQNTALKYLYCANNTLTALDISSNILLYELSCSNNSLTDLDISKNTALKKVYCYNNNFSTEALDDIFCSLPERQSSDQAKIYPLYNSNDAGYSTVMATNKQNAITKNWKVQYGSGGDIPATTGNHICRVSATVTTSDATDVAKTTATLNGAVTPGEDVIDEKGFEWKKTTESTYTDLVSNSTSDTFTANLTGLTANTSYTFRAYAKVGATKTYGAAKTFTTLDIIHAEVSTLNATDVDHTVATLNGVVIAGDDVIAEKGFEWKETASGTYADVVCVSTDDTISANLTGLTPNTGYTFRAYAKIGTTKKYGAEYTFTTVEATLNIHRWIDIKVSTRENIKLGFAANDPTISIKVVYSGTSQTINGLTTDPSSQQVFYTGYNNSIRIYGDLSGLDCSGNGYNLSTIDASNNTELEKLICDRNWLWRLDVSKNTALSQLSCNKNQLDTLDVSNNTALHTLSCNNNRLTMLDVSNNTALRVLNCYGNRLTVQAWDKIYCDLPEITAPEFGTMYPIENANSGDSAIIKRTSSQNAINKGWKLQYAETSQSIPATTGNYICGTVIPATVTTLDATNVSYTTATLNSVVAPGSNIINEIGFKYKETDGGTYSGIMGNYTTDEVAIEINNLIPATNYTFKAYAILGTDTIFGAEKTFTTQIPEVNMERYIDITVMQDSILSFGFAGKAENTGVKLVSGTNTQYALVGEFTTPISNYQAKGTTIRVYGDVTGLDCNFNGEKITGLDFSHNKEMKEIFCMDNSITSLDVSDNKNLSMLYCQNNLLTSLNISNDTTLKNVYCENNKLTSLVMNNNTNLMYLYCHDNNFSTEALDDIFCALPLRAESDNAMIFPVYNASSDNHTIVMATDSRNAKNKNWKVQYADTYQDILATTGNHICIVGEVNESRWIELKVAKGEQIQFDFGANVPVPIRIESGTYSQILMADDVWCQDQTPEDTYLAQDSIIRIYGDITGFNCNENSDKLTRLDVSHNPALEELFCSFNELSSLNVSNNPALTELFCALDQLTSLDIRSCTALRTLVCDGNQLTALDISNNTALKELSCHTNSLTSLDIRNNTALMLLMCFDNPFTTQALDDIYCSLPEREQDDDAAIFPILMPYSSNSSIVKKTNSKNAIVKNWEVLYAEDYTVVATTGTHDCSTAIPATVTTLDATAVTHNSAKLSGVVAPGTDVIAERGFEWKMTLGGTYADLISNQTSNTFDTILINLTANTDYTFRAYVKVGSDKIYGAEKTFVTPTTGIKNIAQMVSIYPNPAKDKLNIKSDNTIESLELYDALGRMVMRKNTVSDNASLDVSSLNNGIYILKLRTAGGIEEYKVAIE